MAVSRHVVSRALRVVAASVAALSFVAVVPGGGAGAATPGHPEGGKYFPYDNPGELVTHVYGDILFRAPSTSELAAQSANVRNGRTAATLAVKLGQTPEFHKTVAPQARLYQAFFLRGADRAGLQYWVGRSRAGMSANKIGDFFTTSDEFKARYGALNDTQFVALIYTNVLDRPGETDGQDFWVQKLGEGWSRGRVMAFFSESKENQQRTSTRNRITLSYVQVVGTAPSEPTMSSWLTRIAGGATSQTLLDELYASAQLTRRATLISAGGPSNTWTYGIPGWQARWNPCGTVTWRLNPTGAPANARADIREAVRRISAATGLTFVEGPDTTKVPVTLWNDGSPGELYIAYATEAQRPDLRGLAGLGGFTFGGNTYNGFEPIQHAYVLMNRDATPVMRVPGFEPVSNGSVLLHELGHAMGLGHSTDRTQAMYRSSGAGWNGRRWGNSDLAGLSSVGSQRGCFPGGTDAGNDTLRTAVITDPVSHAHG